MADRRGRLGDFFEEIGDDLQDAAANAKAVLGTAFGAVHDAAENVIESISDGFGDNADRGIGAAGGLIADRADRLEADDGVLGGIRDGFQAVRQVVGEVLDPVRDVGRAVANAAGNVVEAVTFGALDIDAVEGQGLTFEADLLGRQFDLNVDTDGSDGQLGVGVDKSGGLLQVDGGFGADIDARDGNAGVQLGVGGSALDGNRLGTGVAINNARAEGQRGLDLAGFVEAENAQGQTIRTETGLTVNRDFSDGQVGLDAGFAAEVLVDGVRQGRQEVALTANIDASNSQVGLDAGFAAESFVGDDEALRVESVRTVNFGTSDGQVELDLGRAVEVIADGAQVGRIEGGVTVKFGAEGSVLDNGSGGFVETEVGQDEALRGEVLVAAARFGTDDGALIADAGFGGELFVGGESVADGFRGLGVSLSLNEKGHLVGSLDSVNRLTAAGEQLVDGRQSRFFISTDLTDPENIKNIITLATTAGLIPPGAIPDPGALADIFGGDPSGILDLVTGNSEVLGRISESLGVEASIVENLASIVSGDGVEVGGLLGDLGIDAAGLADQLGLEESLVERGLGLVEDVRIGSRADGTGDEAGESTDPDRDGEESEVGSSDPGGTLGDAQQEVTDVARRGLLGDFLDDVVGEDRPLRGVVDQVAQRLNEGEDDGGGRLFSRLETALSSLGGDDGDGNGGVGALIGQSVSGALARLGGQSEGDAEGDASPLRQVLGDGLRSALGALTAPDAGPEGDDTPGAGADGEGAGAGSPLQNLLDRGIQALQGAGSADPDAEGEAGVAADDAGGRGLLGLLAERVGSAINGLAEPEAEAGAGADAEAGAGAAADGSRGGLLGLLTDRVGQAVASLGQPDEGDTGAEGGGLLGLISGRVGDAITQLGQARAGRCGRGRHRRQRRRRSRYGRRAAGAAPERHRGPGRPSQ